jgi:hypothetical protein
MNAAEKPAETYAKLAESRAKPAENVHQPVSPQRFSNQ